MKFAFVLCVLALALQACALFGDSRDRALRSNPSFREGYEDGCASATGQGSDLRNRPVGNPGLYKGDDTYRAGWSNGYETCRRSDVAPGVSPGNGAINLPGPGH